MYAARQQELQVAIVKKDFGILEDQQMKELKKARKRKIYYLSSNRWCGAAIKIDSNASQTTGYIEHLSLGLNTTITYQGWFVK